MNDRDRVHRLVTSWLESEAPLGARPELLEHIVSTTGRARPRPRWLARMKGNHMDVIEGGRGRGALRLIPILVVLGLLAVLVAGLAAVGAFRNDPPAIAVVDPVASGESTPFMRPIIPGEPLPDSVIGSWRERQGDEYGVLYMHILRAGDPVCLAYVQTTQDCSVLQWAADDLYLSDIQILTIQEGKIHQVEFLGRNCTPRSTDFTFEVSANAFFIEPTPPTPCNSASLDFVRAGIDGVPLAKPPKNGAAPAR